MGPLMDRYLIDTNILIHILAGDIPFDAYSRMSEIYSGGFSISIISKIELLGWKNNTPDRLATARELIQEVDIVPLSDRVADIAINLRQNYSIRLPDAVIAATALHMRAILITRNVKDFRGIQDLSIYNPFE